MPCHQALGGGQSLPGRCGVQQFCFRHPAYGAALCVFVRREAFSHLQHSHRTSASACTTLISTCADYAAGTRACSIRACLRLALPAVLWPCSIMALPCCRSMQWYLLNTAVQGAVTCCACKPAFKGCAAVSEGGVGCTNWHSVSAQLQVIDMGSCAAA
jgi:hypothetical protein